MMRHVILCGVSLGALITAGASMAQDRGPSYTFFGTPGLLEMPTAEGAPRSQISSTIGYSGSGGYKLSFTYQLSDRFWGAFRYSAFDVYRPDEDRTGPGETGETFDRSFDLQYRLTDESTYLPAIAVGLRDFLGTGRFSSEYIVGSKSFGPNLIVSAGLGWGEMGSYNGIENPLGRIDPAFYDRPVYVDRTFADEPGEGNGGTISTNQFFRGDMAVFGGVEYQINPKLGVKAEYSTISYDPDIYAAAVDRESPWNFGVTYRPTDGTEFSLAYLYGTELSASATFLINPEKRPVASGLDPAPAPVRVRTADQAAALTWDQAKQPEPAVRAGLAQLLAVEGIDLVGLQITDRTARLRYANTRFRSEAQAMGRAARMMTQIIPPSVNTFIMEPTANGIPLSATTLRRSDIEALENRVGAADALYQRASIDASGPTDGLVLQPQEGPRFKWGIAPYMALILFNRNSPVNADYGLSFEAEYQIAPNLKVEGRVLQSVLGEQKPLTFFDTPNDYVNVRTDGAFFGRHGGPTLERLTLTHYSRPGKDIYGRITAGYLERMYGGISGEVLWKPVGSRLALGAEVNYAALRDQDMGFGFALYETVREDGLRNRVEVGDYDVVTGHLSAYYELGRGYHAQVDVGRYLAGDWGATFSLDREFENGWKVGGYFTLTDMPFDDFGEGSFDKGIRISIPFDYFIGTPSQKSVSTTLQSLARDGGARLDVDGRLYDVVRGGHQTDLTDTWGRFWR